LTTKKKIITQVDFGIYSTFTARGIFETADLKVCSLNTSYSKIIPHIAYIKNKNESLKGVK